MTPLNTSYYPSSVQRKASLISVQSECTLHKNQPLIEKTSPAKSDYTIGMQVYIDDDTDWKCSNFEMDNVIKGVGPPAPTSTQVIRKKSDPVEKAVVESNFIVKVQFWKNDRFIGLNDISTDGLFL